MKTTKSGQNIYAELGFPDAEEMLVKAGLVRALSQLLKAQGLSQVTAAKKLGLSQPKLSNLLRGQFRGVSEMKLMECLAKLGQDVEIVVRPQKRRGGMGRVAVLG